MCDEYPGPFGGGAESPTAPPCRGQCESQLPTPSTMFTVISSLTDSHTLSVRLHQVHTSLDEYPGAFKEGVETPTAPTDPSREQRESRLLTPFCDVQSHLQSYGQSLADSTSQSTQDFSNEEIPRHLRREPSAFNPTRRAYLSPRLNNP